MPEDVEPRTNRDFAWATFDPESYFHHYYGDPHPDDIRVAKLTAIALAEAQPRGHSLDIVDVGTGSSFLPWLAALPRAKSLAAWEYSEPNLRWLAQELGRERLRPQWGSFWDAIRADLPRECLLPDDPTSRLREVCALHQGSIFDLPERCWDAATMFFCAESITEQVDEFERACAAFARCTMASGTLVAAFLAQSSGYEVSHQRFPALSVDERLLRRTFAPLADDLSIIPIGLADKEVRSGYSGMFFLRAKAR